MKRCSEKGPVSLFLILIFFQIMASSCAKKEVPVLETWDVLLITNESAVSGGTIINNGTSAIVTIGICWNTDPEPTIQDFKTSEMVGQLQFSSTMRGLVSATKYYVRAYAVNDEGVGYGNEVIFTTK